MLIIFVVLLLFPFSCHNSPGRDQENGQNTEDDFTQVIKDGVLHVVVDYNSTNYFVYRGRPMGFQYELLKKLAEDLKLELELVVSNNLKETFDGLNSGRFDLVAKNLTVTKERGEMVNFTNPLLLTRQILVQRKPEGWEDMDEQELEGKLIRDQLDLANQKVVVQKNTAYYNRLMNLSDEIGDSIIIEEDTIYGVERLVALVAHGEIDYTVCDENVAMVNQGYYPNLDIATPISFNQKLAWAVRKKSVELLNYLNTWIGNFKQTKEYERIYAKYFRINRTKLRISSGYHSVSGGKLSLYDEQIRELSVRYGWDWRLIASIIYQESRFDPEAESWAGAMGLMQLMPETADIFGVIEIYKPRENITGGLKLLNWLDKQLMDSIPDRNERLKFVLASYNVGLGHVKDAQRLAKKYGKDPFLWEDNVDYFLLNKSASKYYKDPVVRWGYCRGEEPFHYVSDVLERYGHYTNLLN